MYASKLADGIQYRDFIDAPTVEEILIELFMSKDIQAIYDIFDSVYREILNSSEEALWEDSIIYTFGLGIEKSRDKYGPIIKNGYIDMILRNAFFINEKIFGFDQEWRLENVPAKFILQRAIVQFYYSFKKANNILPIENIARYYGLENSWKDFQNVEKLFGGLVTDDVLLSEYFAFKGNPAGSSVNSINRLLKK